MRSDLAVAKIRDACFLPPESQAPEFTDTRILRDLSDKVRSLFGEPIIKAASGYWRKTQPFTTTNGAAVYRNPPRSLMGGLIALERFDNDRWVPLTSSDPRDQANTTSTGIPCSYFHDGDVVLLAPVPDGVYQLRFVFYISPSEIVRSQSSTLGGDLVDRGRIVGVSVLNRTIDVNVVPYDQALATPAAISIPGGQKIDVIAPRGWHELSAFSLTVSSITGTQFQIGGTEDLSRIQVGDYVRAECQTDWAPLPREGQRLLTDATAAKLLVDLDDFQKSEAVSQKIQADLGRFLESLEPRTQTQPKRVPIYFRGYR